MRLLAALGCLRVMVLSTILFALLLTDTMLFLRSMRLALVMVILP